jgi:hypothetical protein
MMKDNKAEKEKIYFFVHEAIPRGGPLGPWPSASRLSFDSRKR